MVLHRERLDPLALQRVARWRGSRGAGRAPPPPASTAKRRSRWSTDSRKARSVSQSSRSPMWWPTQARCPFATQAVLLSWAPQARSGRSAGTGRARLAGTHPRERRIRSGRRPGTARTTESSTRVWMGRSWSSSRSAIDPRRSQRVLVAVRDRLVGEVAARHHQRAAGVRRAAGGGAGSRGASRPRSAERGRHRRRRRPRRAPRRQHDRPLAPAEQRLLGGAQAHEAAGRGERRRTMTAKGFSSRRLRAAQPGRRRPRRRPGRPGGSRRCPSRRRSRPSRMAAAAAATGSSRPTAPARWRPPGGPTGRSPGRRWARRGSAGRPGPRTRRGRGRTSRSRPSWWCAVVGDAQDDRVAGAAGRAVDERVAVAAVGGVAQLGEAVGAGGRVGGDPRRGLVAARRWRGSRSRGRRAAASPRLDALDRGQGRARRRQALQEAVHRRAVAPRPRAAPRGRRSGRTRRGRGRVARRWTCGRKPTPWTVPSTRTRTRRGRRSRRRALDELPEDVPGARLGLLDARDVLRAGHHDVVGEPLGRDPAAVVADHRHGRSARAGAPRRGRR